MKMKPLVIGNLRAKYPIVQGGMGVGVSRWRLAGTVAREGGIGIISAAQIGYDEPEFAQQPMAVNLKAIKKHIDKAREIANGGVIGVNIMVATHQYEKYVTATCEAGADVIISGAGLPVCLPQLVSGFDVKIAPIVSSAKAASVLLKMWDRKHNRTADFVVVEGPKAGGHLGFKREQVENISGVDFDQIVVDVIACVTPYEEKYQTKIPVIVAGGIFDREDIQHIISLGADGVQMGTRFVATDECDASDEFKRAYINAKKEDIQLITSPVGMPGRAIATSFVERTACAKIPVRKCYQCLKNCNPLDTPYCITRSLLNAVDGHIDDGLVFCGENACRVHKMSSVKDVFAELVY